jgi:hypothetical protein
MDHIFLIWATRIATSFFRASRIKQNEKAARQQGDLFFFKGE